MYDPKCEAHEFFGESEADATSKAADFFGVEPGELTMKTLVEISGQGKRALVIAVPTNAERPSQSRGGDRGGERGGDRDRDRDRGGRGRDRDDRGGRGGRGRDRDDRGGRGRDRDRDRDRDRGERSEERVAAAPAAPAAPSEPTKATVEGDVGPVGEFIVGVLERMDLGPFTVSVSEEDRFQIFEVSGPASERVTDGDPRAADALQLLANQAAAQAFEDPKRVVVDVAGSRDSRDELLSRMAGRAAKRAGDTGRTVALDPMNGKDRREIHMALRDEDGVATMSIGEGRYRQVLVVPEGAAEYEDAKASSEKTGD